jgi:hypothetical protein
VTEPAPGPLEVFIPFWGDPELLYATVESVRAQTDPDWMITVVDDCYPDPTVAEHFEAETDPRIHYLRNEVNVGITDNYQRCRELASGELMMFLGCDDLMHPRFVETVKAAHREFPQAATIQVGVQVIDEHDAPIDPLTDKVKRAIRPRVPLPRQGRDLPLPSDRRARPGPGARLAGPDRGRRHQGGAGVPDGRRAGERPDAPPGRDHHHVHHRPRPRGAPVSGVTILGLAGSIIILLALFEMMRRHRLREKYALIWALVALAIITVAAFPSLLIRTSEAIGLEVPANLLFFAASMVIMVLTLQHSSELGRLEERTRTLAEEVALLKQHQQGQPAAER